MRKLSLLGVLVAAALASTVEAAPIQVGVQLYSSNKAGYVLLGSGDTAGVVAQTNWNAVSTTTLPAAASSSFLLDSSGNTTAVKLKGTGIDGWNLCAGTSGASTASATGDGKLLNQFSGSSADYSYTFTGLDSADHYDLFVYFAGDRNDYTGSFSVGSVIKNVKVQQGSAFDGTFIESTGSAVAGNYIKFADVTADGSGNLTINRTTDKYWQFSASGLQLVPVSVPEPTALGVVALTGLLSLRRRQA